MPGVRIQLYERRKRKRMDTEIVASFGISHYLTKHLEIPEGDATI